MKKLTFALCLGNRGLFPESLVSSARHQLAARLDALGYGTLLLDESATRCGAVESTADGRIYARFLEANRGAFDGVILSLPNFGDETGAVAALKDAGVPIYVHAYPDDLDKMDVSLRRDAYCGKISVMNVFIQSGVQFTALTPHVVHPDSKAFERNITDFAAVCRVVSGMSRMAVGAIGARTTAFKTVRFDELALQRVGVTVETFDLSGVMARTRRLADDDSDVIAKGKFLSAYTNCSNVPADSFATMSKFGVALDRLIAEEQLDAIALRCWLELEMELRIAPCTIVSELNDRGIPASCEVDVCSAVAMQALSLASGRPPACLDWNNNYGDDEEKCILFHCGPVPQSLMAGKGEVVDHAILAKALGAGCSFGPVVGRIAPTPMTYCGVTTNKGRVSFYIGEGEITADPIAADYFGCAGVAKIPGLQNKLRSLGYAGYRHHVTITPGHVAAAVTEALTRYLDYDLTVL